MVFADPDTRYWRPDLALLGELEPDPTTSDAREPDEGYECVADQDCWVMYNNYNCICVTNCVEYDIVALIICAVGLGLCPPTCFKHCVIEFDWTECSWCVYGCAVALTYCSGACLVYQNFCHCERVGIGRWGGLRPGRSARWLKVLWRTVKSAYPGSLFLLFGLLTLSFAAERAIRSDIEGAFRFCVGGIAALGVFVSAAGRARKSRALEILGGTLATAGLAVVLYIRFGIIGLVAPLAPFPALVYYVLFVRRDPGEPR